MAVLIYDDQHIFRAGLTQLLREFWPDEEIHETGKITEAQIMLAELSGLDLVVVGLSKPGTLHSVVLSTTLMSLPLVPTVVITELVTHENLLDLQKAGVSGVIHRLASPNTILCLLAIARDGERYFPVPHDPAELAEARPSDLHEQPDLFHEAAQHTRESVELTNRQEQVLVGLAFGKSNKQIARDLGISESTVKAHIRGLMKKTQANNRTQLAISAAELLPLTSWDRTRVIKN